MFYGNYKMNLYVLFNFIFVLFLCFVLRKCNKRDKTTVMQRSNFLS